MDTFLKQVSYITQKYLKLFATYRGTWYEISLQTRTCHIIVEVNTFFYW